MKPFRAYWSHKHIAYGVMCAAVLAGLFMTLHAQALPLRIDSQLSVAMTQHTSMVDCTPCAACYIGPPFNAHKTGDGDQPGLDIVPLTRRFVSKTSTCAIVSEVVDVPVLALRILYCRWLN
jgi:hypothetical protein